MSLYKMNKTDYDILKELVKDSTNSYLKIGKKLGISSITVSKRCEKMREAGIVFGASIIIDVSLLGYKGKAFLFIEYSSSDELDSFKNNILKIPNLFLFADIIGDYDALAMVAYRDNSELEEISNKIRANNCVRMVKMAITTDTLFPVTEEYLKKKQ